MITSRFPLLFVALFFGIGSLFGDVVVIPLKGDVSKAQFMFIRRALKQAERDQSSMVILDMDTYGGELQAAVEIVDALGKTSIPTATYINHNAGSAGALIAMGTKKIYMNPVSAIGAAAPVSSGGEDLSKTMNEKTVAYFSKYFRSAAERNGHNPDVAEAFINKQKEVKIGDKIVSAKDDLLALSANEAAELYNGKPLLAAGIAESIEEIPRKAGLTGSAGTVRSMNPTGFERLAFWITTFAPILLIVGIAAAYIEFKTPGFGLPGSIAAGAFLLFFVGHFVAGLAGFEVMAAFLIGLALVLAEVVLAPGTILPGLLGAMLMLGSLVWAMVDRYPGEPSLPNSAMLVHPMLNLVLALVGGAGAIALLARYLPKTAFFSRILLATSGKEGAGLGAQTADMHAVGIGETGVAHTTLRPSGKARFGSRLFDVATAGEFVEAGAPVRVAAVKGTRIEVEPV